MTPKSDHVLLCSVTLTPRSPAGVGRAYLTGKYGLSKERTTPTFSNPLKQTESTGRTQISEFWFIKSRTAIPGGVGVKQQELSLVFINMKGHFLRHLTNILVVTV